MQQNCYFSRLYIKELTLRLGRSRVLHATDAAVANTSINKSLERRVMPPTHASNWWPLVTAVSVLEQLSQRDHVWAGLKITYTLFLYTFRTLSLQTA